VQRGITSGRADDNIESIEKRLRVFANESIPVIKYFEQLGIVKNIDAEQQVDQVTAATLASFQTNK
jgi:adenylate kinase family enzyme